MFVTQLFSSSLLSALSLDASVADHPVPVNPPVVSHPQIPSQKTRSMASISSTRTQYTNHLSHGDEALGKSNATIVTSNFSPSVHAGMRDAMPRIYGNKPPDDNRTVKASPWIPADSTRRLPRPSSALSDVPCAWGGLWITVQDGTLLFRDDGGHETRNQSICHLLAIVASAFPDLPDFPPTYLCTHDRPRAQVPGPLYLAFSIDTIATCHETQRVRAVPDNVFDHWRTAGIEDYTSTCITLAESGRKPAKLAKAGWIGNVNMAPVRKHLLELGNAHSDVLEVINTGYWKEVPGVSRFEVTESRYYSLPEQVERYAYLLDVEGYGWSGRLKMLFHSGRPVLLQQRQWEEYYFPKLLPFVHFVPVANDLSDLVSRIKWLQANPEQGSQIGQAGQAFAQHYLTRTAAVETWAEELKGLAVGERL